MSAAPHQIGPYLIEQEIGRGGMAVVYRAKDTRAHAAVALKVLPPHLAGDMRYLQRFQREGKSAARLQHPNIVRTFETGSAGGFHYLVLQYVQGQTLTEQQRERRSLLPPARSVEIIRQVADALDYAHSMGVLHRDIKNSNIMIDREGKALLMDFGVAKLIDEDHTEYTVAGTTVGTPAFMAPEQARGGQVDRRADIYSLGVIAYTLFTGSMPFKADSQPALLHKIVYEPPLLPEELNPAIPPGVLFALKKVLAKSPSGRYATAGEFAQALAKGLTWNPSSGELRAVHERMLVPATAQSQAAVAPSRRVGPLRLLLAGAGGLAALAASLLLLLNAGSPTPAPQASSSPAAEAPTFTLTPPALTLRTFRPDDGDFQVDVPAGWVAGAAPYGQGSVFTFDAPDRMARLFALRVPAGTGGDAMAAAQGALDDFWTAGNLPYASIRVQDGGTAQADGDRQIFDQRAGAVWLGRPVAIAVRAVAQSANVYLVGTVVEATQAEVFAPLYQGAIASLRIDAQSMAQAATPTPTVVPSASPTLTPAPADSTAPAAAVQPAGVVLATPTPPVEPLDATLTAIAATLEALNGTPTPVQTLDPLNQQLTAIAATLEFLNGTTTPGQ